MYESSSQTLIDYFEESILESTHAFDCGNLKYDESYNIYKIAFIKRVWNFGWDQSWGIVIFINV